MKFFRTLTAAAVALLLASNAQAASLPYFTGVSGANPIQGIPGTQVDFNGLITQINNLVTPQTTATYTNFRNLLDNGAMLVQQRGTGIQTCGTTSGVTTSAYSADRFVCDVNVTSGAGRAQASATGGPTGIPNYIKLYRTSGALAQQVCVYQEVPTFDAQPVQGQQVVLSWYAKDLGGYLADNTAGTMTGYVITGTGSDEGLASSFTASPAITPAWTGVATSGTSAQVVTAAWARYTSTPVVIPTGANEIAVAICITPTTGGTAGVTDGVGLTGVQIEQANLTASPFEFRSITTEVPRAQRYFFSLTDAAATRVFGYDEVTTSGTTALISLDLPTTMRAAPTTTVSTATSFGITIPAGTATGCTTLAATATSNTVSTIGLTCTFTATAASGTGGLFVGGATSGTIQASADF